MNLIIHLGLLLISARLVWRLVLKKDAYPQDIPLWIKVVHSVILFSVIMYCWSGIYLFVWLVLHFKQVVDCFDSKPNALGTPFMGLAMLGNGISSIFLLFICIMMAKRQGKVLGWFFLLWPIGFLCSIYTAANRELKVNPSSLVLMSAALISFLFLLSLLFYSIKITRSKLFA